MGQTYVELVGNLSRHFKRWFTAPDTATFEGLCELMVLEHLKNLLSDCIAMYIIEGKSATAADAAVSVDEYVLLHKSSFGQCSVARNVLGWWGSSSDAISQERRPRKGGSV